MRRIVPRVELSLIMLMAAGALLILQRWNFAMFRVGLVVMLGATMLNIAVGNLPRDASPRRAAVLTLGILAVVGVVFGLGVLLVPMLSQMGQGS